MNLGCLGLHVLGINADAVQYCGYYKQYNTQN